MLHILFDKLHILFIIIHTMKKFNKYAQIINSLGGSAQVARDLNFSPENGVQRVNNWKSRGIPSRVLLNHKEYFDRVNHNQLLAADTKAPAVA
ncbi:hypothetical protein SAMN05216316_1098 [Nitrosovibrio sp. Nv6]|nr:hypothetical protein SAMN05216316_1098 [Nitrosovibrio sp. Nv6]